MKYPNTLWGMAETSFGYPSKGYPKSSWNFILLTRWDGSLYKQVVCDLEPEIRRSNTVMGSNKGGWDGWGCAPHMVRATCTLLYNSLVLQYLRNTYNRNIAITTSTSTSTSTTSTSNTRNTTVELSLLGITIVLKLDMHIWIYRVSIMWSIQHGY